MDWAAARETCLREAQRVLGADTLADDAAQEALIRAWRRFDTCTASDPTPWIRAIARNEAIRLVARRIEVRLDDADEPAHQAKVRSDADERLADALQALAERDRLLVLLRYWEDLSYEQVACRMQIPLGTVKVRLHRAHAILRSQLTRDP